MGAFAWWSVLALIVIVASKRYYLGFAVPGIVKPLSPQQKEILRRHFDFYARLAPVRKKNFEKRVSAFIRAKKFVPRDLKAVSEEMRVLISATAIQLTFGLPLVTLKVE